MLFLAFLLSILPSVVSSRYLYIVGGNDVIEPGKYPWQVSLQSAKNHVCGAAVLSDKWLVTAAHCIGSSASFYTAVLGMHNRNNQDGDPKSYDISRIITHPDYIRSGSRGYPNDIALIELSSPADLSGQFAGEIDMAEPAEDFVGNLDCWITGWGKTSNIEPPADILQEANVDVYNNSYCREKHGDKVKDYHICAGKVGTSGGCQGDSGGPLVCRTGSVWKLVGVTSWGRSTCSPYYPTVYARVSYFRQWINSVTDL